MAKNGGFNTLIVQVRGRGDAYYDSRYEPRPALLAKQPASFDPLELMVERAHRAGLKVHAWVNVNLVSDAEPPAARQHIVYLHPEWLMVPRPLAEDLGPHEPARSAISAASVGVRAGAQRPRGRDLPLPHSQGRRRSRHQSHRRHRVALRRGRHPPRLHPVSQRRIRLQRRDARRVPRRRHVAVERRRAPRVRIASPRPPIVLHGDVSAGLAGIPARAIDRAAHENPVDRKGAPPRARC